MKKGFLAILVVLAVTLVSCGSEKEEKEGEQSKEEKVDDTVPEPLTKKELLQKIEEMQATLFNEKEQANTDVGNEMIVLYQEYTTRFPNEPNTAEMMYRCSDVARGINRHNISLQMLQKIIDNHKDFDKYVHCLYFKAFALDNVFNKKEEAKAAYFQVVQEFPQHQYATDSKSRLAIIDLSDEEMIKLFKEKNKGKTTE
jgi:outer membrane protein assembly factor BamD (BamD/ComL family)